MVQMVSLTYIFGLVFQQFPQSKREVLPQYKMDRACAVVFSSCRRLKSMYFSQGWRQKNIHHFQGHKGEVDKAVQTFGSSSKVFIPS